MRKPQNLTTLVLLIAMFLWEQASCQLLGSSYKEAKQTKSAKFYYVYDEVYGFTEKGETGEMSGLLVDLVMSFETYIRQKEGIDIDSEFVYPDKGDFELFLKYVKEGKGGVYGLSNISINEERKKTFDFSPPYLENVTLLLSNASAPKLRSFTEISSTFNGMTAYTLSSSTYHQRLLGIKKEYFPNMEIVEMNTMPPIMEQLRTDSKAFAIVDVNVYIEVLQEKWPIIRHPVGDQKDDQFGIIMPKDCDWKLLLDSFMKEFYGSKEYKEIISKNLGESAVKLLSSINK